MSWRFASAAGIFISVGEYVENKTTMSQNLNSQYFESKEKHKKGFNKIGYIVWAVIAMSSIFWVIKYVVQERDLKPEEAEKVAEFLGTTSFNKDDFVFVDTVNNYKIDVIANSIYKNEKAHLSVIKNDSLGFLYFVKVIKSSDSYPSLIKQWDEQFSRTNSSFNVFNTVDSSKNGRRIENADFEMLKDGEKMIGKLRIFQKGENIYLLQAQSYEDTWASVSSTVDSVLASFAILK